MSQLNVDTIKKADGTGNLTIPNATGTVVTTAGATFTGDIVLGTNSLFIGGTGSANELDDYEEGTFTVTTNSDPTGVISGEDAFYVKIGKMVFIRIIFTVGTNFTNSAVGGLPFNVKDQSTVSALGWNGVSIDGLSSAIFVNAEEASTKIQLYVNGDLTNAHTPSTSGGTYRISVMYQTD